MKWGKFVSSYTQNYDKGNKKFVPKFGKENGVDNFHITTWLNAQGKK
jgi:hypothetical protein